MKYFFQIFLICFSIVSLKAQNTVTIRGIAVDNNFELPIESATAFLSFKKDSTIIDYTQTDEEGKFDLTVRKIDEAVFLTITDDFSGDYVHTFEKDRKSTRLNSSHVAISYA